MKIYERNIGLKLNVLRLVFFFLVVLYILAIVHHFDNLKYLVVLTFLGLSIIRIDNIFITTDSFRISKYYFFGILRRSLNFEKNDFIKMFSFDSDFGENGQSLFYDFNETGMGCLPYLFSSLMPPKIKRREFIFEKTNESGDKIRQIKIILNKQEFDKLDNFIINARVEIL